MQKTNDNRSVNEKKKNEIVVVSQRDSDSAESESSSDTIDSVNNIAINEKVEKNETIEKSNKTANATYSETYRNKKKGMLGEEQFRLTENQSRLARKNNQYNDINRAEEVKQLKEKRADEARAKRAKNDKDPALAAKNKEMKEKKK